MIKMTLLTRILFFAVISCFLLSGEASAQVKSTASVKRNSPFSPNPKGKKQIVSQKTPAPSVEKTVNIESAEKNVQAENNQVENKVQPQTENIKFQTTEFESRSLAKDTLEIAKQATLNALPPTEIYKVGIGDVLFISLQNAPAKDSTYFTVLKDGTVDYPLAGEMVSVLGLTTDEIENVLREKIKLYENPQVSVKVREHNSHLFTVLGMVERPGEKMMQREAMPLFVVRAEAIVHTKADRAVIKRVNAGTETIDLKDKKYEDVLIFPGDIVEFDSTENPHSSGQQFYYIGGDVKEGGQKSFYKGITLTQAIMVAGGLKKSGFLKLPGNKNVIIRRKNEAGLLVSTTYNLKAIKDGKEVDPELKAGDTIEIDN